MAVTNYHTVNGRILGETTGGVRTDYLTDALGSVTATVNPSAQVVNRYMYKPYGGLLAKMGVGADPLNQWVGSLGYRQTGKKYSDVYVRARHYDTANGRWTSKDPIGFDSYDLNLFRYGWNAVVSIQDYSGLKGFCDGRANSNGTGCASYCDGFNDDKRACGGPGNPGATVCSPDNGNMYCFVCMVGCYANCIEPHEKSAHITLQIRTCCKMFQACLAAAKGQPKAEDKCCDFFRDWRNGRGNYDHSRVVDADIKCLKDALITNGCGTNPLSLCGGESKCCQDIRIDLQGREEFKKSHPFDPGKPEPSCPTAAQWKAATGLVIPPVVAGPTPDKCTVRRIIVY